LALEDTADLSQQTVFWDGGAEQQGDVEAKACWAAKKRFKLAGSSKGGFWAQQGLGALGEARGAWRARRIASTNSALGGDVNQSSPYRHSRQVMSDALQILPQSLQELSRLNSWISFP
jgi:hypothetical protein